MSRAPGVLLAVALVGSVGSTGAARWPERLVVRESPTVSSQAVSGELLYTLISQTHTPLRGPYLLERTNLRTGVVRKGPRFSLANLAVASGRLWINGASGSQSRLLEVDPRRLAVIRSIPLPRGPTYYPRLAVTAGPDRSVWIGSSRTLLRVDAATGAVLVRVAAPARLAVADLSADPGGRHLYVSLARVVRGGVEGATVLEYDARSGRMLARSSARLLDESVAGAALTAVPGGVWASFRAGMLGLTIHLRERDLAMVAPPGPGVAQRPAGGLFHWPMSATTVYGGGALWLANDAGIVACLDPRRGTVRASERVPPSRTIDLLAVDPLERRLFALDGSRLGIVRLTPPRRCWS